MENRYRIGKNSVMETGRELPSRTTDVVVAGGGPAGLAAAIGAARAGARVTLVESRSFLGGVATQAMMAALVIAHYANGISREIIDDMVKKGGAPDYEQPRTVDTIPFDPEIFKQSALDMTLAAGVDLLFYTQVCEPIVVDGSVCGIVVENKAGRSAILAKQVIDCTGDADLAFRAGAPCSFGREKDHKTRPFTLLFRAGNVDVEKIVDYVDKNIQEVQPQYRHPKPLTFNGNERVIQRISGFYSLIEKAKEAGELYDEIHYFRLENLMMDRKTVFCNTSRVYQLNGVNPADLTIGEVECRKQIQKIFAFAKKYIPGFEHAFIIDISSALGVRETRRIIGRYTLTDQDAYADRIFEDGIMTVDAKMVKQPCPINLDVHMPEPIEGSEQDWLERYPEKVPFEQHQYQIPYRALLADKVCNLLVAGKTISVSHMLDGFTRNMIPCMRFGQVAGAAAALSALHEVSPHQLDFALLRAELNRQGYAL